MSIENIYDNPTFFEGYLKIRSNPYSGNDVCEIPTFFDMLPSLDGKRILDLGCGYGENLTKFKEMGACEIIGLDISEKMLSMAKEHISGSSNIKLIKCSMECLSEIKSNLGIFDVVVSSLAMHYIQNYSQLINTIYSLLIPNGILLFSQEHPIFTSCTINPHWLKNDKDTVEGLVVSDYPNEGIRHTNWIVDNVIKYHRTFSTLINDLIINNFKIVEVREPIVENCIIEKDRALSRCRHIPDYLFIKAEKQ